MPAIAEMWQIWIGTDQIADGDPGDLGVAEEVTVDGKHLLQVDGNINATVQTIYDRFTKSKEISFTVFREFASKLEAADFWLTGDETMAGVADFTLELTIGGTTWTWKSRDCGWEAFRPKILGVSVTTEYKIIRGGLFTKTSTDAEESPVFYQDAGNLITSRSLYPIIDAGHASDLRSGTLTFTGRDVVE